MSRGQSLLVFGALLVGRAFAATVLVDEASAEMGSVAWSQRERADGTCDVTLSATPAARCAFSGWTAFGDSEPVWPADFRYAGPLTVTVPSNAVIVASFIAASDDYLEFDLSSLFEHGLECNEPFEQTLDVVDSGSFPRLTFKGLPTGLRYDSKKLMLTGAPTVPGVYAVSVTGENASGYAFRGDYDLRVGNLSGVRISGADVETPVDEYLYLAFDELFACTEEPVSVSLDCDIPGLEWRTDWQLIFGTPTAPGAYPVRAAATFSDGLTEEATLVLFVQAPDPEDYGVDLSLLEFVSVGDAFDRDDSVIGVFSADEVPSAISGLPTGLAAVSWTEGGLRHWTLSGRIEKAGRYEVVIAFNRPEGDAIRTRLARKVVFVADVPRVYLEALPDDDTHGTVVGAGPVSPVTDARLVARPAGGYVFAGWYDSFDARLQPFDGSDYRSPTLVVSAEEMFDTLSLRAKFVSKEDDVAPGLYEIDQSEFTFRREDPFETFFDVESASLPTLSFKGLPAGMTCRPEGTGGFLLAYDPASVSRKPDPGYYLVTVTAVNESQRKSTAEFTVHVQNIVDPRVRVKDDYGEWKPGEAIEPISLADAVNFDLGETLSVSGLPRGLAYYARENAGKGIDARTIAGTPTVPGFYTLNFSAKVVKSATTNAQGRVSYAYETLKVTSTLTVLPYPELEITADDEALEVGCKVSGAGNYKAGTKVTLKATPAKGWVFAGWEGLDEVDALPALNPKLTYVTGEDDVWAFANFARVEEDYLLVYEPLLTENGFAAEWTKGENVAESDTAELIAELTETLSYPTVRVSGLPPGVKFSASTFALSGKPTKVGVYHVTVTAKNAGGYSFVRTFDVAVLEADGSLPPIEVLPNDAGVDFLPLSGFQTGRRCLPGSVVLEVGENPLSGAAVKRVSVSGLPKGLSASVATENGRARVSIEGLPTTPGRSVVTLSVSYAAGKTLKSKAAVTVEDGGSHYLFVSALSEDGTVSGEGVVSAGATVRLSAKPTNKDFVFAGWFVADSTGEFVPFQALELHEGIDSRTQSVRFPFCPNEFETGFQVYGRFVAATEDAHPEILTECPIWEIEPDEASRCAVTVRSLSLPKVTVKGLPKGVSFDLARGGFSYVPSSATVPGLYRVTLSLSNLVQKKAVSSVFEIRVRNRVSPMIEGLDPRPDAYPLSRGTSLDPALLRPLVDEGVKLSVKGLPSGISYKGGALVGAPSKAGEYTVTFTATVGSGKNRVTSVATVTLTVSELPAGAVGKFEGVLLAGEEDDPAVVGTISLTAAAAGKVSASAKLPGKNQSFSAKAWDALENDALTLDLEKSSQRLSLNLATGGAWTSWPLSGTALISGREYRIVAQRNSFGAKDGLPEARDALAGMVGKHEADGWRLSIASSGKVTVSGRYDGKSVSGSALLQYDDGFFVRLVKFVGKTRVNAFIFSLDDEGNVTSWHCETQDLQ